VILVYGLSKSSKYNVLECPWRSFPYCKPFQVRYFIFVARCAVPLHLQSFLSVYTPYLCKLYPCHCHSVVHDISQPYGSHVSFRLCRIYKCCMIVLIIRCCNFVMRRCACVVWTCTRIVACCLSDDTGNIYFVCTLESTFSSSLKSTPCFSLTTYYQSLHLRLRSSYACHFSSLHKFTTLIIHNSFTFSLQAQNLPLSQILPTVDPPPSLSDWLNGLLAVHHYFWAYLVHFGSVQ